MKVEKTETGEMLIIQSDEGPRELVVLWLGAAVLYLFFILIVIIEDGFTGMFWVGVMTMAIILVNPLTIWISTSRTFIMSEKGCTVLFHQYQKHYRWDELIIKRYVKGEDQLEESLHSYAPSYMEGVFFTLHKAKCLKWMRPYRYCTYIRPFTSIFVNFYPLGVKEGKGDYKSQIEAYKARTGKKKVYVVMGVTRRQEVYPADKFEFLQYMKKWGVEIEGLTEMDTLLYVDEYD